MRDITFVNQIPALIALPQLQREIRVLNSSILTLFKPAINWIEAESETVALEPACIICYHVPDEITDLQIKAIINAHVPEVELVE